MTSLRTLLPAFIAGATLFSAPAMAADWILQDGSGVVGFSGTQTGKTFHGHFTRYHGTISFDPAQPEAGHAKIIIEMASAVTGDKQRDEALPGHDWFDVKAFPDAVFDITTFKHQSGNHYNAEGTLTIKGVSKPVTLPLSIDIAGTSGLHARGSLQLARTTFNVGLGPWQSPQWVALEVNVDVDVTAHDR